MSKGSILVAGIALTVVAAACGSTNPPAPATPSAVGGPCAASGDCQAGLTCSTGDPGGQCTKGCAADAECGAGGTCSAIEHLCYHVCATAADCTRSGYACVGGTAGHLFCDPPSPADAGTDAGTPDTGTPDAGTPDAGTPDAGTPDAGTADSGSGFTALPPCNSASAYTAATAIAFGGAVGTMYSPRCVTVHVGATVTWTGSFAVHPLAAGTGGSAGNPVMTTSTGASIPFTFPTAGYYPFYCMRHGTATGGGMAGVVQVIP